MVAKQFVGPNRSVYDSTMAAGARLMLCPYELMELEGYASNYQKWLNKLQAAYQSAEFAAAKTITQGMLVAFGARVCATTRAFAAEPSELPIKLKEIKDRATKLSAFGAVNEAVHAWPEPKDHGSFRMVCAFGPKRKAIHAMCCDILKVAYPLQPFDFISRGRGVEAAHHHLDYLIEKENAQYVVTIDIKDCFGSAIKKKVVQLLPLPSKVAEQVLIGDDAKVEVSPMKDGSLGYTLTISNTMELNGAARRGLPQGSSVSGLIMYRAVLGPLLAALFFADRIVQHGDDIAVPAKDILEAEEILKALKSALSTTSVGPLTIVHKIRHVGKGVDFLGYRTIRKPKLFGAQLHKQPSPRSYCRAEQRAHKHYAKAGGGINGLKRVSIYSKRWRISFRLWHANAISKSYLWLTLTSGLVGAEKKPKH